MKTKLVIPKPQNYLLQYRRENGRVRYYLISTPIEVGDEYFKAYSFSSHGIRTFKMDNIITMETV